MLTQAPEVCEQGPSQPTVRTSWSGGSASFWSSRPHRSQNWKLCKHLFPFRRESFSVQSEAEPHWRGGQLGCQAVLALCHCLFACTNLLTLQCNRLSPLMHLHHWHPYSSSI
ncbi:TPA: hypothetical protein ACH3X2_001217 [Trebouxia sp. C0005]